MFLHFNCFRHTSYKNLVTIFSDDNDVPCAKLFSMSDENEQDISRAQLAQNLRATLSTTEVEGFIDIDNIIVLDAADINDIVQEV